MGRGWAMDTWGITYPCPSLIAFRGTVEHTQGCAGLQCCWTAAPRDTAAVNGAAHHSAPGGCNLMMANHKSGGEVALWGRVQWKGTCCQHWSCLVSNSDPVGHSVMVCMLFGTVAQLVLEVIKVNIKDKDGCLWLLLAAQYMWSPRVT